MIFLAPSIAFSAKPSRAVEARKGIDRPSATATAIPCDASEASQNGAVFVFDTDAVLDRVQGNLALLRNLVGLFAMQWKDRCAEIDQATQRRDGSALELTANQLGRSLESLGAAGAARMARHVEACGRRREFDDLDQVRGRLQMEIDQVVSSLQQFASEPTP